MTQRKVLHKLIGYDPTTEFIAFEKDVPAHKLDMVKRVAHVASDDPEAIYSYELTDYEARDVAGIVGFGLPSKDLKFFLEPFAQ